MEADLLAQLDDVEALARRTLSEDEARQAEVLLGQASARFRREARQDFTPGESTVRLQVVGGSVVLRQSPVVDVLSVTGDAGRPVPFHRSGQVLNVAPLAGVAINYPDNSADGVPGYVTVHYTHGGEVPADVRAAIAGAVLRVLDADPDAARGAQQVTDSDTRGPFSRSRTRQFAPWAMGGQLLLSPDDLALARSFRRKVPRVWVMRP